MIITTFLSLAFAVYAAAQEHLPALRGEAAIPQILGLPVFAALQRRQDRTCVVATETLCPNQDGCCPVGEACGYTTTAGTRYGICEGGCNAGAVICTTPISACCDAGEICGANGVCSQGYGATNTAAGTITTGLSRPPSVTFAPVATPTITLPASVSSQISSLWSSEDAYESSLAASESSWQASFDASTSSYWASYSESTAAAAASASASDAAYSASLSASRVAASASRAASSAAAAATTRSGSANGASSDRTQLAVGCGGLLILLSVIMMQG